MIRKVQKVASYKIQIQKALAILYAKNIQIEN